MLEDVERISDLRAWLDGREIPGIDTFCVDPVPMRYEANLHLPPDTPAGQHNLEMRLGRRRFPPLSIEVL